MARALLAQETVQQTLDLIVDHAVRLVAGCTGASIMVIHNGQVHTLASTSSVASTSDRTQGELGEGPCFDAIRQGQEAFRVADLTTGADRWHRFGPMARELGIRSMMGFLLFTEESNLGALDLYSDTRGAFTERSEQVGWVLASHAAVAFASARSDEQLHQAIASRQDIGVALGIMMERYKISQQQAFAVLRKASQNQNIKLREIARTVIETGEIPGVG